MEPFCGFPAEAASRVEWVLTDVDDTLTHRGRLAASTYAALGHGAGGAGFVEVADALLRGRGAP
jgi:hypothetical protein